MTQTSHGQRWPMPDNDWDPLGALRHLIEALGRLVTSGIRWLSEVIENVPPEISPPLASETAWTTTSGRSPALGHLTLTFQADQEEDQWASKCVELGVASCGADAEKAILAAAEAACLYLETLEVIGESNQTLRERQLHVEPGPPHGNEHALLTVSAEGAIQRVPLIKTTTFGSAAKL